MVVRPPKGQEERATLTLPVTTETQGVNKTSLLYDIAVFIGRFQPFHIGHLYVILEALKHARFVMVCPGSADTARRPDHLPFTADERIAMIKAALREVLSEEDVARVIFKPLYDYNNMARWTSAVVRKAGEVAVAVGLDEPKITLIGHSKDASSFYLKAFTSEGWDSIDVPPKTLPGCTVKDCLSATPMRLAYFAKDSAVVDQWLIDEAPKVIPNAVVQWLKTFRLTEAYADMVAEWEFHRDYDKIWESEGSRRGWNKYFVTLDNVVVHTGHILLIQRKNRPGKDLWALPGGHLEMGEYLVQGSIRELREETKIKVAESILKGSLVGTHVFDNPFRSMRKRTITHGHLFNLIPTVPVREKNESAEDYKARVQAALARPKVKAADDAKKAIWVPIEQVLQEMRELMFEDHYQIIETMLAMLPKQD
jgi:bifunctional NMN adenylyltransferase/nudix hydrolase